jgi:hypothetical protein
VLPACCIGTAFFNFSIGATLGVTMAWLLQSWGYLAMLHAELNPIGWLTILIYGMTYAVLKWLANIVSPKPKLAWIQLLVAGAAVVCVAFGFILTSLNLCV